MRKLTSFFHFAEVLSMAERVRTIKTTCLIITVELLLFKNRAWKRGEKINTILNVSIASSACKKTAVLYVISAE